MIGIILFKIVFKMVGLACFGVAIMTTIQFFKVLVISSGIKEWLSTTGTITESRVMVYIKTQKRMNNIGYEDEKTYVPKIKYKFEAKGKTFESDQLNIWRTFGSYLNKQEALKDTQKYPLGTEVTVKYDPIDPKNSIIETGNNKGVMLYIYIIIILPIAGLIFLMI